MSNYTKPSKVYHHMDRLVMWEAGYKPAPVTVEWDLSNRCSLGCQFCHFAHTHTKGPWTGMSRDMTVDVGDFADTALVKRGLEEMSVAGVKAIVWSGGGEPTLHPDWQDIVKFAARCGLKQGMYTLGGHIGKEEAETIGAHMTWVVVSLDADTPEAYAKEKNVKEDRFHMACKGIKCMTEAEGDCIVGVSYLLHARNYRQAWPMVWLARSMDADYTVFRPTILTSPTDPSKPTEDREWMKGVLPIMERMVNEPDVEASPERFSEYMEWKGRDYHTCYAIRLNATVTPDGRIWVCPNRRGMEDSCVGDLLKESFQEAWAKHVGKWTDFKDCRAMCRLHFLNKTIAPLHETHQHAEFL